MTGCIPITTQTVVFRENYPDGVRDTLACGHIVYSNSTAEVDERFCLRCAYKRKPRRRRPPEGRPPTRAREATCLKRR